MIYPLFLYMSRDPRWERHHTRGSIPYTHNHTEHIVNRHSSQLFNTILPSPYCQHHTAKHSHIPPVSTIPKKVRTKQHIVQYSNTSSPNQHFTQHQTPTPPTTNNWNHIHWITTQHFMSRHELTFHNLIHKVTLLIFSSENISNWRNWKNWRKKWVAVQEESKQMVRYVSSPSLLIHFFAIDRRSQRTWRWTFWK